MNGSRIVLLGLVLCGFAAPLQADEAAPASEPALQITTEQDWRESLLFYLFAALTIGSALGVVVSGSVVRMAMWLFAAFGAVAMLFFMLQAFFLAVVQLIVYVGGILVLIVFGIMLTSSSPWLKFEIKRRELVLSGVVCLALFAVLSHGLWHQPWTPTGQMTDGVQMAAIGKRLLTDYLVPFEVASVLLLVVMIGAAYLAKQERH